MIPEGNPSGQPGRFNSRVCFCHFRADSVASETEENMHRFTSDGIDPVSRVKKWLLLSKGIVA